MDLFQLLSLFKNLVQLVQTANLVNPFCVDIEKLIAKFTFDFSWDYESIKPAENQLRQTCLVCLGGHLAHLFLALLQLTKQIPPESSHKQA